MRAATLSVVRPLIAIIALLLLLPGVAAAQPATSQAGAIARAPMPDAVLVPLLRHEGGPLAEKISDGVLLQASHDLESFFASGADRKGIGRQLAALNLDPNLLGRLARVRADWPAVQNGIYFIDNTLSPSRGQYWLVIPTAYDRSRAWPVVLDLPELPPVKQAARPPAADPEQFEKLAADAATIYPDAVIVVPIPDADGGLGPGRVGMNRAMAALDDAASLANIDPARVVVVGHSIAGFWAWNLALHEPTYFAGVEILAGSADVPWLRTRMVNLHNTLAVVWHDRDDKVMPIDDARTDVEVLRRLGGDVLFEQTTGLGHEPPNDLLARLAAPLRGTRRQLYPADVVIQSARIEPAYNRADWVLMDQPLDGGRETKQLAAHGHEIVRMYGNTFRVDATCRDNQIDVKTDNVASLRLFFNDQMIDFGKPVTVVINGRQHYQRRLRPDVATMLADQLFLGRGWRYFTAAIDIELVPTPATRAATTRAAQGDQ